MKLAKITVWSDGGPWADHNMPCAVCHINHAVYDLNTGRFEPCWSCQQHGWVLKHRSKVGKKLDKLKGM